MAVSKIETFKKWIKIVLIVAIAATSAILAPDVYMSLSTQSQLYKQVEALPEQETALVLGTSKYIRRTLNPYYQYRIDAAIELFKQNKVSHFLLSGDNAHRSYNEPWTMKRDLLKAGIPEDRITLDYAGFRTLDSVQRAKEIFDANSLTIVSQQFHCQRAVFIANHFDMDTVCLVVPSPSGWANTKIRFREVLARTKAVLDLYIFNVQPKFLGPKEPIDHRTLPKE
ncbi:vancomycin high temperature exclusion protein [Aliivibrio fischeri]|uniref:SanA protein n=1 Tax=Aliivibrio fischeri TaxID=668 RepID=A0A6N3Z796_ALIFS|nr:ElyC/SanA/YdcF family protein [Aliivibrio fischeri]MCE7553541.1 YdcF family protein [Aliivibrio fischeri]MCE7561607.1 YdcF family protein [Aliivibrio fischeri]MCE7569015.1 YdcF family protein [Aliivibrio fischeri]MUK46840.1 SanA protein [Aliivibrio fischeri]MUK82707.1 SanA protein [Aliivibrio fischeri]